MTAQPRILIYGDFLHNGTEVESQQQKRDDKRFLVAPRCISLEEPRTAANSLTFQVKIADSAPPNGIIKLIPPETEPILEFDYQDGEKWKATRDQRIPAHKFRDGVTFRLTAVRAAIWKQGEYPVQILWESSEGETASVGFLWIMLAPFLLHSSLNPVSEVLVVKNKLTEKFVGELEPIVKAAGAKLHPLEFPSEAPWDVWMQDCIEIGGYSTPAKNEPHSTPAFLPGIRGLHDGIETKTLDAEAVKSLRGMGLESAINLTSRPHTRWIDWYGNLEVSPPCKSKSGKNFPLGRVLYGKQGELTMHPDVLKFLEAQGVQTPALAVNTSWLTIGHVDEVVNFVPARDRKRFRVLLPSPALAVHLLEQAAQHGHGDAFVFPGKKEQVTVEKLLETVGRSEENKAIQMAVDATQTQLKEELGLADADFVPMPVLFEEGLSVIPNGVNGLVVNGHYIIPAPCGAIVAGKDIFAEAIRSRLVKLGLMLHFVDVWEPYHSRSGEIHCGTNVLRRPARAEWWKYLAP